jgi:aspartate 1-decarboxylase
MSRVDFDDQTLKNCVNIIHVDLVEIWNLSDKARVSSSVVCCAGCLWGLVSLER